MPKNLSSSAVMARRNISTQGLDPYWTPPNATRALCEHILDGYGGSTRIAAMRAIDPAAGMGHIVDTCEEYFSEAEGSDIYDYGRGFRKQDFLTYPDELDEEMDAIITNPPFNKADDFVLKALSLNPAITAVLARVQLMEGQSRYRKLWQTRPAHIIAPFSQRVSMARLQIDMSISSASMYAWFVWFSDAMLSEISIEKYQTRVDHIPPHIERWTHPSDPVKTEPLPEPELSYAYS